LSASPEARGQTKNAEAYELYLRGRFLWYKRRQADHERALELFEQAIARDPNFALAYAAVGDVCIVDSYKCPEGVDCSAKGRNYATKALELEPTLGEPYAIRANIAWAEKNWTKADQDFLRSIELNPSYGDAHHWRAEMLTRMGRHDEAIAEINTALVLDPFNQVFTSDAAYIYVYARRFEEGLALARRSHEMNAEWSAHEIAWALEYLGRYDEALDAFKGYPPGFSKDPLKIEAFNAELVKIREHYRSDGVQGYWRAWREFEQRMLDAGEGGSHYYGLAVFNAELGEKDKAIAALNKSFETGELDVSLSLPEPHFDSLRDEPGFVEILRKLKLHE
jgi:tetratricopeptide (TPR) repeat protein